MCITNAVCGCRIDEAAMPRRRCTPQMQLEAISAKEMPSCLKYVAPLLCCVLYADVKCVLSPGKVTLTTVRVNRLMVAGPFECGYPKTSSSAKRAKTTCWDAAVPLNRELQQC